MALNKKVIYSGEAIREQHDDTANVELGKVGNYGWDSDSLEWKRVSTDATGKLNVNADVTIPPVTIDPTGLATDTNQTNGSQKTQLVDAGGEAVTITGGKLDVNASVDTTGLALASNQQTDALTNTELRATPVPVSIDSIAGGQTINIEGGNAQAVNIDGGNSSAVNVTESNPLDISGLATATKQSDNSQTTQIVDAAGNAVSVTGNKLDVNATASLAGTALPISGATDGVGVAILDGSGNQITSFGGGTQYTEGDTDASITGTALMWEDSSNTLATVSAANPLPVLASIDTTGLATSANQQTDALTDTELRATPVPISGTITANAGTDLNTSTLALESGGNLAAIKAKTDNIPAQGQALAGASLPVVLTAAQVTTLTPPAAITGFATEAKQLVDNHQVTVSNITSTPVITGFATSARQDTIIGHIDGIEGYIDGIETTLTAVNNKLVTGTDIGDVTINNASGIAAVNIQDGGNAITVDGSVTAISGTAANLKVEATLAAAQTLGTLSTITNVVHVDDNAGALTVDGTVAVTNAGITTIAGAVSGTEMQVDVLTMPTVTVNSHAVTNAGTFAVQADTELTTGDLDTGAGTDTRAVVGLVGSKSGGGEIIPGSATDGLLVNLGSNNDVTVTNSTAANLKVEATMAAGQTVGIAAGTVGIGKLTANSGVDIGDVDILSIAAGDNNIGNVDVVTMPTITVNSHAVTNAGTFAVQSTNQANSGVDIGDVTINNSTGAAAVNIQDGGNTITVDGAVTVTNGTAANLKAEATLAAGQTLATLTTITNVVHVDDNAGALTVDGTVTSNLSATDNAVLDSIDISEASHYITGIAHGVKTVTTAGTDLALAASTACKRVDIQAQTDNTSLIAVGASGVDATIATGTGIILYPGDVYSLEIDNLADVYIDSLVNGEGVRFCYYT